MFDLQENIASKLKPPPKKQPRPCFSRSAYRLKSLIKRRRAGVDILFNSKI